MLRFLPAPLPVIAILIAIAIVIAPSSVATAQSTDAHPHVLIPYNDHGEWGYCDTLGNIQIKPQYKSAYFFNARTIGEAEVYLSAVETKWGQT
ncbi:MAG: WG repeat-containing protein, partial [Bacteroidota bacterium]